MFLRGAASFQSAHRAEWEFDVLEVSKGLDGNVFLLMLAFYFLWP
jgi:hypothetical protein